MIWGALAVACIPAFAQEDKKAAAPVAFPKLEVYEPLWTRSIFTTKDLPAPEVPGGPNFADNLSLSGVYEIDGAVVAVLVDRTTSQVSEARIGSENDMGIKIRQVTPGATVDKTRIQLQKGDQAGWVTFADPAASQPAEVVQRAVIPTQGNGAIPPQAAPGAFARSVPPQAATGTPARSMPPQRRPMNAPPASVRSMPPVNPILPPPSAPAPAAITPAAPVNDVPLPPP